MPNLSDLINGKLTFSEPEKIRRRKQVKKYQDTPIAVYKLLLRQAKLRGFICSLTFKEFMGLWQKPCTYCGSSIKEIGIDRIDSDLGYIPSNIASCCSICNIMKRHHSIDFFLNHCKKIIEYSLR